MSAIVSIKIGDGSSLTPEDWFVVCGKYNTGVSAAGSIKMFRAAAWTATPPGMALAFYGGSGNILAQISNAAILSLPTYDPYDEDTIIDTGIVLSEPAYQYGFVDGSCGYVSPCDDNSDCPEGQKCVDGECVDCEEEQATHFRFRVEFDRETAVPDLGGNVSKIEIPPRSIATMNSSTIIETASYSNLICLVRAIPCDASGNPKPYNGNASFKCNAQSNTNQGLIEYVSGVESGWKHTGMINSSADGITGYQYTRIEVYGIEESALVYEEGCGGYVAEEPIQIPITGGPPIIPPPQEPVEPEVLPPPSEPLPPDDWPEPWEPPYTPPINPVPPTQPISPEEPSAGCECEIYLAQYIGSRLVWLVTAVLNVKDTLYNFTLASYDIINSFIQFLSSVYSNFSLFLVEFLELIYQTALHFVTVYQNEQFKNRAKIDEVIDELKTFNTKFAEFSDNYEPVQIENEYRTQSHRIIDNLDSTLNKL